MKKTFICLLLLTPRLLLAQPTVEELEQRLDTANSVASRARAAADRPALIQALGDTGRAQFALDDPAAALASYRLALKLAREIEDQPAIAGNLLAIGRIHFEAGRVSAAAETLRRAAAAAEQAGDEELLRDAHASASQAYAATGRFQDAHEAARRATELGRSLAEKSAREQVAELKARHQAELEAVEVEAAARQQELDQARRKAAGRDSRLRLTTGLAIAGGVALLLLVLSLAGRTRLRRRSARILAEKDAALARAEDELQRSSDERDRLSTLRDGLSVELLEAAGERDRLSVELESSAAKLERTSEQLEQNFIELKRTTSDRDRAIAELTQFAGERDSNIAALEQTSSEVERVSAELERTLVERDQHVAQLERTTAEAERISDALMQASAERDQTAAERDRLTAQLARVSDELERLRLDCRQDISAMADRNAAARDRMIDMERFNSTLSQHLKVLLVAVRSSLGALQQDVAAGDVEQLEKDVKRTHLAVGNTVRLLDELQKLLLVGRVVHAPEAASMSELAYEAVGQVSGLADRRVEVVIAPAMPAVYGDRAQLLEVLRRLLENGGKFMSDQPSPRLQVGYRRDWPRADTAEDVFYVRDNGIGIESRDLDRVFALFEKLDSDSEGLGIGLPLVRRIVEAHGGRVWVESDGLGRGSTFCFTLSAKYAAPPVSRPQPAEDAAGE